MLFSRFELPASSTPSTIDCDRCGLSRTYSDEHADSIAERGCCAECHRLDVIADDAETDALLAADAAAFGVTVEELRAANARTDEEQAAWLAEDRRRNPEYYADLNWGRTDELLAGDPAFPGVCDERVNAAIEHREASNERTLTGEAA